MTNDTSIEPLLRASIDNQIDVVRQLLKDNLTQDLKDEAFGLAIAYGNLEIADLLLHKGAGLNSNLGDNMYWACHNKKFDSVKYLVNKGVDINCQNGVVAFMLTQTGNLEMIKWIDQKGANLHIRDDAPLINAIIYDKMEVVEYLLAKGANPNAQDGSPIREAGIRGNLEMLIRLIDKGGKIEGYRAQAKKMKATWFIKPEHISIIKYLLTTDIDEQNRNDFILNWLINYPNRENRLFDKRPFSQTEVMLIDNGLDVKMFLPKKQWFGIFGN